MCYMKEGNSYIVLPRRTKKDYRGRNHDPRVWGICTYV